MLKNYSLLLLAAGESKRMGPKNKLLTPLKGQKVTLIESTLNRWAPFSFGEKIIVLGHQHKELRAAVNLQGWKVVLCENYKAGMGASLAQGFQKIDPAHKGAFVALGDMPSMTHLSLVSFFKEALVHDKFILRPLKQDSKGHPVFFPNSYYPLLKQITGDEGAKSILKKNEKYLHFITVEDDGFFQDYDYRKYFAK